MNITFRQFGNDPGEPLLSPVGPFDAAVRLQRFTEDSGIDDRLLATTIICGTPVPIYPASWPQGCRRWAGVAPEFLWHPLAWLPHAVYARRYVQIGEQAPRIEDDDQWVTRILVEVSAAAKQHPQDPDQWVPLYDETTGGWLDILALHGLNLEDPKVQQRVEDWLGGEADPVLDDIDLAEWFNTGLDSDWGVEYAWGAISAIEPTAMAVHAQALAEHVEDMLEADLDVEEAGTNFGLVASIAANSLAGIEGESEWWEQALESWDRTLDHMRSHLMPQALTRLERIASVLEEQAGGTEPDPGPEPQAPAPVNIDPDWEGLSEELWDAE